MLDEMKLNPPMPEMKSRATPPWTRREPLARILVAADLGINMPNCRDMPMAREPIFIPPSWNFDIESYRFRVDHFPCPRSFFARRLTVLPVPPHVAHVSNSDENVGSFVEYSAPGT
jgi:hypothetical protein